MPGLSWSPSSTVKTNSSSGTDITTPSTREGSPFVRANSLSSLDSLSILTSPIADETNSKGKSPSSLIDSTTALFAPLRLFDSFNKDLAGTSSSSSSSSLPIPSTPRLLSPKSSTFSSSLESNYSRASTSASSAFTMPRSPFKVHRRHHCRRCGSCFCDQHSSNSLILTAAQEDVLLYARKDQQCSGSPFIVDENGQLQPIESEQGEENGSSTGKRYFRARVCDGCFYLIQKVKSKIEEAIVSDGEGTTTTQGGSSFSTGKGWNTPTILEDDEEFFDARDRVQSELQRDQMEVLKVLRNDLSANRIVATAVESRETGSSPTKLHHSTSPLLDCSKSLEAILSNELILDPQMETAAVWEKVKLKQRKDAIAKRALSLDSIMMANGHNTSDADKMNDDWEIELKTVLDQSNKPIFDRSYATRPASPQPFVRHSPPKQYPFGFEDGQQDKTFPNPFSTSQATPRIGKMGAGRLQQSIESSLSTTSRITMRLPEAFSKR